MNKLIIASALAASVALGMSSAAEAKTSIKFYFGVPHYDYQVDRDYRYRSGYGWYNPGKRYRLTCGEARREVRREGFRNVSAIECNGRTYTFRAVRNGDRQIVYVDARTGNVWRGRG